MIPIFIGTAKYSDGFALGIVGFKKFFIELHEYEKTNNSDICFAQIDEFDCYECSVNG